MARLKSVVITGGGTGGHVSPALAIGAALSERVSGLQVRFVGGRRGIEGAMVRARGGKIDLLPAEPLPRAIGAGVPRFVVGLGRSMIACSRVFHEVRPDLCVATGGYASIPAALSARVGGLPLYVQEQNAAPGLASRLLARLSRKAFVAFDDALGAMPRRSVLSGNPIRLDVGTVDRAEARRRFGLPRDRFVLFAFGGSQGAHRLNDALSHSAVQLGGAGITALWQTGPNDFELARRTVEDGKLDWVVRAFIDDMPAAYAACDLSLSRAGALSVAELTAAGVPMILVPYPFAAAGHQTRNARSLAARGAAVVVADAELTPERLAVEVVALARNEARRRAMADASRALGRPNAARDVAAAVVADWERWRAHRRGGVA